MATTTTPEITAPRFTVDMLETLPDNRYRYELLDGFLLVTPPPRPMHEEIVSRLRRALEAAFADSGVGRVGGPAAIYKAETTYFEPDLLVYPAHYLANNPDVAWRDITEWWLVVEVLSPGSRVYDTTHKREAYLKLGVESVWLVDIDARRVEVWTRGATEPRVFDDGDVLRWEPGRGAAPIALDVTELFRGTGEQRPGEDE